jgi:hypothetical protein
VKEKNVTSAQAMQVTPAHRISCQNNRGMVAQTQARDMALQHSMLAQPSSFDCVTFDSCAAMLFGMPCNTHWVSSISTPQNHDRFPFPARSSFPYHRKVPCKGMCASNTRIDQVER